VHRRCIPQGVHRRCISRVPPKVVIPGSLLRWVFLSLVNSRFTVGLGTLCGGFLSSFCSVSLLGTVRTSPDYQLYDIMRVSLGSWPGVTSLAVHAPQHPFHCWSTLCAPLNLPFYTFLHFCSKCRSCPYTLVKVVHSHPGITEE